MAHNLNALFVFEGLTEALAMNVCTCVRLCVAMGWCP